MTSKIDLITETEGLRCYSYFRTRVITVFRVSTIGGYSLYEFACEDPRPPSIPATHRVSKDNLESELRFYQPDLRKWTKVTRSLLTDSTPTLTPQETPNPELGEWSLTIQYKRASNEVINISWEKCGDVHTPGLYKGVSTNILRVNGFVSPCTFELFAYIYYHNGKTLLVKEQR